MDCVAIGGRRRSSSNLDVIQSGFAAGQRKSCCFAVPGRALAQPPRAIRNGATSTPPIGSPWASKGMSQAAISKVACLFIWGRFSPLPTFSSVAILMAWADESLRWNATGGRVTCQ